MKTKKVGKITLALTLISLGILLLFRSRIDVLKILELYIPAVLVLLGLEILISKLYYERKDYSIKANVGSIVFTVIIVFIIGGILTTARIVDRDMLDFNMFRLDIFNEIRYSNSAELQDEIELNMASELNLYTEYSDIEFLKGSGEKIRIEGRVEYRYNKQENANLELEDIIQVGRSGDVLEVSYKKRKVESLRDIDIKHISYKVYIPEKLENANLNISYSNAVLQNIDIETATIKSNYSEVYMANLEGDKDIDLNYGSLDMENISGNCSLKTNYTGVDIKDLDGRLTLDSNYGEISLENIEESIRAKLNYSDLDLINEDTLKSGMIITGNYSDVKVDIPDGQEGYYDINVKSGDIDMGRLEDSGELSLSENRVYGRIGNEDIPIEIELKSGDMSFE